MVAISQQVSALTLRKRVSELANEFIELSFQLVLLLLALTKPPGFDELPVDVDGVVQVEKQPLASIQESQTEKVVIDEGCGGVGHGVPQESRPRVTGAAFLVK